MYILFSSHIQIHMPHPHLQFQRLFDLLFLFSLVTPLLPLMRWQLYQIYLLCYLIFQNILSILFRNAYALLNLINHTHIHQFSVSYSNLIRIFGLYLFHFHLTTPPLHCLYKSDLPIPNNLFVH